MVTENKQSGFSTIEILIACAILVTVFSAVILLVLGSQRISLDTQVAHEGQLLAQKYLEEGRAAAISDFNSSQAATTNVAIAGENYTLTRTQTYISPCVKTITSRASWTIEGRAQYVNSVTQISNPSFALLSGSPCAASEPPGGGNAWDSCYEYSSADLPSSNYDAYDTAIANIGGNKYLFMVGNPSNQNKPEDFWVYNINNTSAPAFVSKLDANLDNQKGIFSLAVARNQSNGKYYAFLAGNDNKNQLIAIDVSNPAVPGVPVILNIPGFGNNVNPKSIEYFNNKIYMSIGNTIQVINVSNPAVLPTPTVISFNNSVTVNKIALNDDYLFAATSDNNAELVRISLANYSSTTSFNAPGNDDGTAVYVTGGTAYLGRVQNSSDLMVIDASGASLTSLGSKDLNHQNNSNVVDLAISGRLLFVASNSSNKELQVFDISNPANITLKCQNNAVNPTNVGYGLTFFENYVYMAMRSNSELAIFADHQ